MNPRSLLRAEGLATFLAATGAYLALDGPLWLFALLILAPDLSMLGYALGNRAGAAVYNAGHTYVLPLTVGAFGYWGSSRLVVLGALVWTAHIGADRLLGYGLKYPNGFKDTHLSRIADRSDDPAPVPTVEPSD